MNIRFKRTPQLSRVDLTYKGLERSAKQESGSMESGSSFFVSDKGSVIGLVKQDIKMPFFDLLLEIRAIFSIDPIPQKKIDEDKELETELTNMMLPYVSEVVSYLTGKMGITPLVLPPMVVKHPGLRRKEKTRSGH